MQYPKIQTLWNRDKDTFKVIPWDFRRPEFELVSKWQAFEKVDGMNIRVIYGNGQVRFAGRTDRAQLPGDLVTRLNELFPAEKMAEIFPDQAGFPSEEEVILFGEGYGPGIQKGGGYRKDKDFILFDVRVGRWWLERENILDVASNLGLDTVPFIDDIFELPTSEDDLYSLIPHSVVAWRNGMGSDLQAEGIVCKTPLFNRYGERVMWKLKFSDFKEGKR